MKPAIRITIADDHPIFRQGLRQIIESDPLLEVVAEAGDGHAAVEQIETLSPDVAILDVSMPGRDGLAVTRALRDRRLPTAVVCLTMHKDARFVNAALDAGVKGYVLKDSAVAEIVQCAKAVHAGQSYISPVLSPHLLTRRQRAEALTSRTPEIDGLTSTERKVLGLIAELKTTKEIASVLCVSPRTVDHHRANIAAKLELHGSHALTRFAIEHRSALNDA